LFITSSLKTDESLKWLSLLSATVGGLHPAVDAFLLKSAAREGKREFFIYVFSRIRMREKTWAFPEPDRQP